MQKIFLVSGSLSACIAIILGAFCAHALKDKIESTQLQIFETGVRYQFYHALALICVFLLAGKVSPTILSYSGLFFIAGTLFFSGSLYLLAIRDLIGISSWKSVLGPITPLGGLCFIVGWGMLIWGALKWNGAG